MPVLHLGVSPMMHFRVRRRGAAGGQQADLLPRGLGVPYRLFCRPEAQAVLRPLLYIPRKGFIVRFYPSEGIFLSLASRGRDPCLLVVLQKGRCLVARRREL